MSSSSVVRTVSQASILFHQYLKNKIDEQNQIKLHMEDKKKVNIADMAGEADKLRDRDDHRIPVEDLCQKLKTDPVTGMSNQVAEEKFRVIGPNALSERKGTPWYCKYIQELTGFFCLLLWAGAILCWVAYGLTPSDPSNLYLGIALAVVVLVTGTFSYTQNAKSEAIMAQFKNFIPPKAFVIRAGVQESIDAFKLVPGDVVIVKGGNNIPADIRIIECNEMKVNNSSLTGETEELLRKTECTMQNPLETANMAFFGTQCTVGTGKGIVVSTGDRTVIGNIANLAQSATATQTTLAKELDRFIKIISVFALSLGVIFFVLGIIVGYKIINSVVFAIGMIVSNVPEGLLATVTVSLSLAAKKMATKNVLVKNLQCVETLGSTSCICSDKTGTLTQNVMTVSNLWYDGVMHDASVNYEVYKKDQTKNEIGYDLNDPGFRTLLRSVALGTTCIFTFTPSDDDIKRQISQILKKNVSKVSARDIHNHGERAKNELIENENNALYLHKHTHGDASETGLIKFAQPIVSLNEERNKFKIHKTTDGELCEIPFNSVMKFNLIIRDMSPEGDDRYLLLMKGAPERIWSRCSRVLYKGQEVPKDEEWQKRYDEANLSLGKRGERVLAFAKLHLDQEKYPRDYPFDTKAEPKNFPMADLTFVGLVSLNDPPRIGVLQSVIKCRTAGIKVIMVTGDQPVTAASIAKKVGIITNEKNEYNTLVSQGVPKEKALEECTAIVIHGDKLAKRNSKEEHKHDRDPSKGEFLRRWLSVREVVFARTTPSQKLLIVDGCQKLGYIVGVTGDGVNDSPAIKKADIGIAMGSGSDVAKDAADMILLDDNFSSILHGIEGGRLMFDNLKKCISYALAANMPEIIPFVFFIIFQTPAPLTTVLMLVICLGTDIHPAISFAYEPAELDIMKRKPRNAKMDHLAGAKLIGYSYFTVGFIEAFAGLYTYFLVMADYGYEPLTLFFLNNRNGIEPLPGDVYDPSKPNERYGNHGTNVRVLDWTTNNDAGIDVRLFYYDKPPSAWRNCNFDSMSKVTNVPACHSTDALKYAQTAYFAAVVITQWSDLLICKTRILSIAQQGFANRVSFWAIISETCVMILCIWVPFLNVGFATRALNFWHVFIPAFPFFILMFLYDEFRKFMVRRSFNAKSGEFEGWWAINTCY